MILMLMALGRTENDNKIGNDGRHNKTHIDDNQGKDSQDDTVSSTDEGRENFAFGRYFNSDLQRHTIEFAVGKVDYDSVKKELEHRALGWLTLS